MSLCWNSRSIRFSRLVSAGSCFGFSMTSMSASSASAAFFTVPYLLRYQVRT
jgi:hypothetical protein